MQFPKVIFFSKPEFYSSLKNEIIDDESYESIKKFWKLMRLNKLSDLNDNFQDTIILCEVFENRAIEMMQKFPYNPRKCTSASSHSGCIHRFSLKVIIALPTQAEIVDLFEQTLVGGFSCVHTTLGFDLKLLLPQNSDGKPKENLKIIYKISNEHKRIVTKILKMGKNDQYGNAMTKPLPTDSIKRKKVPTMREFDLIIQVISDEDKICHLFVVDKHFDQKNVSKRQLFFNEIYSPIFEKKKVLSANERSVCELLDAMRLNDEATINSFKTTAKTHAIMDEKISPTFSFDEMWVESNKN